MFNILRGVSYPTTTCNIFLKQAFHSQTVLSSHKAHQVAAPKLEQYVSEKWVSILKRRVQNHEEELVRLKKDSNISLQLSSLEEHIKRLAKNNECWKNTFTLAQQCAYARSIEIQNAFKETHYVFTHGQSTDYMLLNIVIRHLTSINSSSLSSESEVLRHPCHLELINSETHNVKWYKNALQNGGDKNHEALISVDGYPSLKTSESALFYFLLNWNAASLDIPDKKNTIISDIARYHILDTDKQEKFLEEFALLDKQLSKSGKGNIYSIIVTKEYFKECGYLSGDFGIPYVCSKNKEENEILEEMQRAISPERTDLPQVRLLMHMLNPEKVRIFVSSTIPDTEVQKITKLSENLIK